MRDQLSTLHGDLRLLQRVDDLDCTMTELWDDSLECSVKYQSYDEARVSPEYGIVLLKNGERITTVLPDTHNVTIEGRDFEEYIENALEANDG